MVSLSLIPLPVLMPREIEGRLKCLAWSAAREQQNYAEVVRPRKAAGVFLPPHPYLHKCIRNTVWLIIPFQEGGVKK